MCSLPGLWQKINGVCLFCQWWQESDQRRLSAMTVIAIGILSLLLLTAAVWSAISHDPPREAPHSHASDRDFLPPGALLH